MKRLTERFGDTPPERMALMTVVLEPTTDLGDAFAAFDAARHAIRNLRTRRHWPAIQIAGWLETDALCHDDMPLLGSQRHALLASLGHAPPTDNAPLWWPSIHGIVSLDKLAHQEFRMALSDLWSAIGQVDVRPLYNDKPVSLSIQKITEYCLKHECSQSFAGQDSPWPPEWVAQYYSELYKKKKGFRGISFSTGIINKQYDNFSKSINDSISFDNDEDEEYNYMPMVI